MNRSLHALCFAALIAAAAASLPPRPAQAAAGKAPDVMTALSPAQSPPPSAAQRAKFDAALRAASVAPAPAAPAGGKVAPQTTAGLPRPDVPREPLLEGKLTGLPPGLLQRDLATALGRPSGVSLAGPPLSKPAPLSRSLPADPAQRQAQAAARAEKAAHALPVVTAPGPKPAGFETRGAAPAPLDARAAGQARAGGDRRRRGVAMNARARILGAAIAATLTLSTVHAANSACTYHTLTSAVSVPTAGSPEHYQFNQTAFYWSAVAVRPQFGDDWDVAVFSGTDADPLCVSGMLASSTFGGATLDFVIGDFNVNALGTYYARANRFSGAANALVEWEGTAEALTANTDATQASMAGSNLVRVYDVFLNAGLPYTFHFYPQGGSGAHMLLFRNTAGGTYWAGRSAAQFDVTGSTTYTAPANGFYAVVIANDGAAAFNYSVGVSQSSCGIATQLAPQVPLTFPSPGAVVAFDAEVPDWMGLAVRSSLGDWDGQLFTLPSGGAAPTCLAHPVAGSGFGAGAVDLLVGDFNRSPHGFLFGYPSMFSGGTPGTAEFTGSQNVLVPNDSYTAGSFAVTDLAHMYDVYLRAGQTYALSFYPPAAGVNLLLFANPGGGSYYTGRSGAAVATAGSTTYTAPADGYYGLAVVNDAATSGTYFLAVGDCSQVTALTPGVPATAGAAHSYFSFDQQSIFWTAVAVRNTSVDWDIAAGADSASSPWPGCTTAPLASSSGVPPLQDFVVGDFNYAPRGRYFIHADQYTAGFTSPATLQWDSGGDVIVPNDNNVTGRATGPNDVIGCWDVLLVAGRSYAFDLQHGGGADLKLMLFGNPGTSPYWTGRAGALFSTTTTQTFTPATTAFYGVVVVNDNGAGDSYNVRVRTCDPIASVAATPAVSSIGNPLTVSSFTQPNAYWCPVAVRSQSAFEDWDTQAYSSGTGGALGTCASGLLAGSSYVLGFTDYVIGDFNFVTPGTYYVADRRFSGTGAAYTQFHPSSQALTPNGTLLVRHVTADFLVQSWDALLTAGQTYTVFFTHDDALHAKVDVFQPTGGPLWTNRNSAMLESAYSRTFVAPVSGWYAVVVVNDGGSGQFNLNLFNGTTAVDGTPRPDRDALRSISPNPGRGDLRFDYALHDGADVSFELLDMAGRMVTRYAPGSKGAGEWSERWRAADAGGHPLPAGMYFVRMRAGERLVGSRKVALLE